MAEPDSMLSPGSMADGVPPRLAGSGSGTADLSGSLMSRMCRAGGEEEESAFRSEGSFDVDPR